jgi:hyperosmotically inducible protein
MRRLVPVLVIILLSFQLNGCLLAVAGAAGEAGYVAAQERSAKTTISDQLITTKVKTKLIGDEIVKARNVNVDTYDGVVTLRGIVFSPKQRVRAKSIASETIGVKRVVSHLKVSD